ncbi:MAG: DUF3806 domain-containing protein [Gammaproteobacteria bacterium]|nr:DUF3806 domain-containing protein [Gammaproteobacteria bacterium]
MTTISKLLLILLSLLTFDFAAAEESGLRELTSEELERYEFDVEEVPATVKELSLGQRYSLDTQRRETMDLIARRLGVLNLKGDKSDLKVLQNLVDRKAIGRGDVRGLQSLGIVFGDVLVNEFGLTWVSYEDDIGTSKALRWKKTENYVFPVTLFSKRVQFKEDINMAGVFEEIGAEVERFIAYEASKPVFK